MNPKCKDVEWLGNAPQQLIFAPRWQRQETGNSESKSLRLLALVPHGMYVVRVAYDMCDAVAVALSVAAHGQHSGKAFILLGTLHSCIPPQESASALAGYHYVTALTGLTIDRNPTGALCAHLSNDRTAALILLYCSNCLRTSLPRHANHGTEYKVGVCYTQITEAASSNQQQSHSGQRQQKAKQGQRLTNHASRLDKR